MSNEPPKPWIRDEWLGTGDLNTTFGHRPSEPTEPIEPTPSFARNQGTARPMS